MTSGRDQKELTGVSLLGNKTKYPTDYAPEVLEAFINKHPGNDYFVKFSCIYSAFAIMAIFTKIA